MDVFGIVSIPSWIVVFAFTFYVCYLYLSRKYNALECLQGVPGPKPLPLIGNSLQDFFSITHEKDIENQKKYGRIYRFYEGRQMTLRISDPAILKEILVKQFNNFTDRRHVEIAKFDPLLAKMLSVLHGDEWKTTRSVMSPTFTSGKLKQMVPIIGKLSQKMVDVLAEKADTGESLDAKDIYISYLLEVIGTCAFGVEIKSDDKSNKPSFVEYSKRLIFERPMINFFLLLLLPQKLSSALNITIFDVEAMTYIKKMLRSVIQTRESGNERRVDFLQIMLDALKDANSKEASTASEEKRESEDDQNKQDVKAVLTPDGVLAQSILFLIAGFITTSTALSYISYNASTNPSCQDKMIEEIDRILANNEDKMSWETIAQMTYMDMFIAETLRMYPPLTRIDRQCTQDTQIGELRIAKDTVINILAYAIHHDEEFYPDPYKFDPERFSPENKERRNPYTYLAFGVGPRNCIGMRFALMEVKLPLIAILKNFRFCRSPKTKDPLEFRKGHMQLKPSEAIHVTLERRSTERN